MNFQREQKHKGFVFYSRCFGQPWKGFKQESGGIRFSFKRVIWTAVCEESNCDNLGRRSWGLEEGIVMDMQRGRTLKERGYRT